MMEETLQHTQAKLEEHEISELEILCATYEERKQIAQNCSISYGALKEYRDLLEYYERRAAQRE